MHVRWLHFVVVLGALAGCAGQSALKPTEVLDERTGVTVAALREPIEFVCETRVASATPEHRSSFAYLGPVEWDRMGAIRYALWVHVAPGNDFRIEDIQAAGAVAVVLDDGPLVMSPTDAPKLVQEPYQPVVSWGQTAYFELTGQALKRMAASRKLSLALLGADGSTVVFIPIRDAQAALSEYVQSRGVIVD